MVFGNRSMFGKWTASLVGGTLVAMTVLSVAWAHAGPLAMSPTDGATVTALPAVVSMETSQAMQVGAGTSLVVVNSMGTQVTTAAATVDPANPKHISVPLPAGLPAGTYSVRWSTLSAEDGETTSGSWSFTYAPAQAIATATPTLAATATGIAAPTVTAPHGRQSQSSRPPRQTPVWAGSRARAPGRCRWYCWPLRRWRSASAPG